MKIIFICMIFFVISINGYAMNMPNQPLTPPLPAKSGSQNITAEYLLSLPAPTFGNTHIKWLDNNHIVYALPPVEKNKEPQIATINVNTNERSVLGYGSTVLPSPDGQWILFTRGEDDKKQLWIMKNNGTNARQLSNVESGLGYYEFSFTFAWSADSKKIILSHQPLVLGWENKKQSATKIDIINISSGQSNEIASIDGKIRYLLVTSNEAIFVKERVSNLYNEEDDHEWIQSLNLVNRQIKTLAHFSGLQQFLSPALSPDGKQLAITYDPDVPLFSIIPSVGIINIKKNIDEPTINRITKEIKLWNPIWSKDGKKIYAIRELGAFHQLYSINSNNGELKQLTNMPLRVKAYSLSPDGLQIAWISQDAHGNRRIQTAKSDGSNKRDLVFMPSVPENIALGEVREIEWETFEYPSKIRGLLFLPTNYKKGTRYPLIVDIHGGGPSAGINLNGGLLVSTPLEWQMWAAKGYIVFVPELRSSGAFGFLINILLISRLS